MRHVGVLGALPDEVAALVQILEGAAVVERAGRHFHQGVLGDHRITVVHAHVGKVAAAITATVLIEHFGVEELIFTGLAGALADDLSPGDVVVAAGLVQHDLDARPLFPRLEVPLTGVAEFLTDASISGRLEAAALAFQAERGRHLSSEVLGALPATGKVRRGIIATGDLFVSSVAQRDSVREAVPAALCVEMEGAAVAQVAHAFGVPVAILRVISDRADGDAAELLMAALGTFAGAYARGILGPVLRG